MKVKYFMETDTLYIRLNDREPGETTELTENVGLTSTATARWSP